MLVIAQHQIPISSILVSFLLLIGLMLSILSYMQICTSACEAGHHYKFLGLPFEYSGIAFFTALLFLQLFNQQLIMGLLICCALGAEVWFILMQKFVIQHWCPLCLGIASTLLLTGLVLFFPFINSFRKQYQNRQRGELMSSLFKSFSGSALFLIGFFVAFFGVVKIDEVQAAQDAIKDNIAFGNKNSPIEIYLFTDWQCPACRELQPVFEGMSPDLMKEGQILFVDFPIHQATLNFTPFNLAFMINNKDKYWELRDKLEEISIETSEPTEAMVQKMAQSAGTRYKPLNFADITIGQKFFSKLGKLYEINQTPTLIVVNRENKKGKKLVGGEEITEENVMKTIHNLKK